MIHFSSSSLRISLSGVASASLLSLIVVACSGSSSASPTTSGSTCDDAATALCDRAVDCSGDGTARIVETGDGGLTASINSASKQDCLSLYQGLGCANGGDSTIDYATCNSDLAAAACGPDATGKMGVLSPASCASKH